MRSTGSARRRTRRRPHLGKLSALRVGIEAVDVTAEYHAPLVRLRDVEELGAEGDDASRNGLMGSDTKACSRWLSIGSLRPASAATCEVWPATTMAVRPPRSAPPRPHAHHRPSRITKPVTSQFSMMSTPRRSAARA